MECDICKCKETKQKDNIFLCDGCKLGYCKTCSKLTSSEVKVLQLRERVLKFNCDRCRRFETQLLLENIISDKDNIIKSKDEVIDLLKQKIQYLEKHQEKDQMSFSEILKKTEKKSNNANIPNIIIKPRKPQNADKTKSDIKQNIKLESLKIGIKGTRSTKNGSVIIKCENKKDIDVLKSNAEDILTDYDVQLTKMKLPRFKITNYEGNLDLQSIESSLRDQNDFIVDDDKLKITFVRKIKHKNSSIIFGECTPSLFHKFMCVKKVFIGWERCPIYEDLSIMRCFKCQELYHKNSECQNEVVCEFCAEQHEVKDCPKIKKQCKNCVKTNNKYKVNYNTDHTSADHLCPSFQYQVSVLKSKIDYGYC